MPGIRIALALVGAATLPVPLGTAVPPWDVSVDPSVGGPSTGIRYVPAGRAHARAASGSPDTSASARRTSLDDVARRMDRLDEGLRDLEAVLEEEIAPLARILEDRHSAPDTLASRIALALVRESRHTGLAPELLLAVLLVENPWLDPQVRSFMGAVGLMQVMPFHAGAWGCSGTDLTDPEVNVCHGARILAHAIRRSGGDLDRALLRYNGCVRGANTPDCHRYPAWVQGRLERLSGTQPLHRVMP